MKENITLTALNAHLQQNITDIQTLRVFADLEIIKEDKDFLFMYEIKIGAEETDPAIFISMLYRIHENGVMISEKVKYYLYEIHPYLLELVGCLLRQCLQV